MMKRLYILFHVPSILFFFSSFVFSPASSAHPEGVSIAINFGANEPTELGVRTDVTEEAGILNTVNWNNLDQPTGGPVFLDADDAGESFTTDVEVEWVSNNTWASFGKGEENNTAPDGGHRNLMGGYLDTTDTSITTVTVTGLDTVIEEGTTYTVIVYTNGGVIGRGGDYTIDGVTQGGADDQPFDGTFFLGEDYLVFDSMTGDSFTISADGTRPAGGTMRAPINGIEIVEGELELAAPVRTISLESPPDTCPPDGLGPVAVTLSQALKEGDDPSAFITVTEQVTGDVDADAVSADNEGDVSDLTLTSVEILWDVTRQQLSDGLTYTIDQKEGSYTFSGTADETFIEGEQFITVGCDLRVTNVTCTQNGQGGVEVTWENHELADPETEIIIELNGEELTTVGGTKTSATIQQSSLAIGINNVCVINSSGLPACSSFFNNAINLSDIVGGGDGSGNAPPENVGLSQDTGLFVQTITSANVANTTMDNPQPVFDSDYIDSVFIINGLVAPPEMAITSTGVLYPFSDLDVSDSYGLILKDITHDYDKNITDIWAGGENHWQYCIAIHAAAGITFDLAMLRDLHGPLQTFTCFAGTDQCTTANLNMYAICSSEEEILAERSVLGLAVNTGEAISMEIPEDAMFLTLAVGAGDGAISCDHGVFADPAIIPGGSSGPQFQRGDINADGGVNIADAVAILGYQFAGAAEPVCMDAADANDDGSVNLADAVAVLSHRFAGTGPLKEPFESCGTDPTDDELGCISFPPCE